jgi:hypothetical protein
MDEEDYKGENLDVCCVSVARAEKREDLPPCRLPSFLSLLSGDIDAHLYPLCIGSFTHTAAPSTYALCTPSQKRLVLYKATHRIIQKGKKGRLVLPACMTLAIRAAHPDRVTL